MLRVLAILLASITPDATQLATVRVTVQGTCGTGTIVGRNEVETFILTNAHVSGTRIGRTVAITSWNQDGLQSTTTATIKVAAYNNRTGTDWAILTSTHERLRTQTPVPIKISRSTRSPTMTTGCPRCEWPSQRILNVRTETGRWAFTPNAIGGQSGSSLTRENLPTTDPVTVALLTWSDGRNGLAQDGTTVARQIMDRTTESDSGPITEAMIPISFGPPQPTETGFFATELVETSTLPIFMD